MALPALADDDLLAVEDLPDPLLVLLEELLLAVPEADLLAPDAVLFLAVDLLAVEEPALLVLDVALLLAPDFLAVLRLDVNSPWELRFGLAFLAVLLLEELEALLLLLEEALFLALPDVDLPAVLLLAVLPVLRLAPDLLEELDLLLLEAKVPSALRLGVALLAVLLLALLAALLLLLEEVLFLALPDVDLPALLLLEEPD